MAKINALIKMNSSDPVLGPFPLNFIKEVNFDFVDVASDTISVPSDSSTTLVASTVTVPSYVYILNRGNATNILLQTTGGVQFGIIEPGDFTFITVKSSTVLTIKAASSSVDCDYIVMTKSS
tara:strand:+ start:3550 stop:3915 length:366 start_codon:yes stop_codon:yes gene_type:complete